MEGNRPKPPKPLSDAYLRGSHSKWPHQTRLADGGGLYLRNHEKHGVRSWRLDYRLKGGTLRTLTIGRYPDVSLSAAREVRANAKSLIARGIDPVEDERLRNREAEAEARRDEAMFEKVAERWLASIKSGLSDVTHGRISGRLANHVTPAFTGRHIGSLTEADLLDCLRKIQRSGAVYSGIRILNYLQRLFRFAKAERLIERNPAVDISDALAQPPSVKHRARLTLKDMPRFFSKLDQSALRPETRDLLLLALYTWARPGEVRFAEWSEFEGLESDAPIWRIPAARTKMRRPLICPLSSPAVEVLRRAHERTGKNKFVFAAPTKSGVVSENAGLGGLRALGFDAATFHGFRGLGSTAANEMGQNGDVVEAQLGHIQGSVRRAYNGAEYLSQRTDLMRWWADLMEEQKLKAAIG